MHAAHILVVLLSAAAPRDVGRFAEAGVLEAAEAQAQPGEAPAVSCDAAVDGMDATTVATAPRCKTKKAAFCRRLETREGLAIVLEQGEPAKGEASKLCGKDVARIQAALCPAAAKEYVRGGARVVEALVFIGQSCPAEARPIARRECAGRSYTDLEGAFREFCTAYARRALDAGELEVTPAKAAPPGEMPGPSEVDDGKIPQGRLPRK